MIEIFDIIELQYNIQILHADNITTLYIYYIGIHFINNSIIFEIKVL